MNELEKMIAEATSGAFVGATESVENSMKDSIQKYVYDAYTPNKYNRSGQFKEAYKILDYGNTPNKHSAILGFDYFVMKSDPAEYRHYSPIYGSPFILGLPEAIQSGSTGASGFFGSGDFSKPRDFMQDYYRIVGWFEDNFIRWTWEDSGLKIQKK